MIRQPTHTKVFMASAMNGISEKIKNPESLSLFHSIGKAQEIYKGVKIRSELSKNNLMEQ